MCHIGTCMCIVTSNDYCPRQSCLQDLEEDQHRTHGHREGSQRGYVVLLAGTRQEHRGHDAVGEHILEVHHRALGGFRFQVSGFRFQVSLNERLLRAGQILHGGGVFSVHCTVFLNDIYNYPDKTW